MSPTVLPIARRETGLSGRHVLAAMLGFFGIVFAVNGVMLYKALSTHSGLVANEPYRKGLAYNTRIEADERQAGLGWTMEVSAGRDGRVVVVLGDAVQAPISGRLLSGRIGRPSSSQDDRRLAFVETKPGHYLAESGSVAAGAWQADVEVREADATSEPIYRARRRLWLEP